MPAPIGRVEALRGYGPVGRARAPQGNTSFEALLEREIAPRKEQAPAEQADGLKLSRHAAARLESRGISLTEEEVGRLEEAIDQLAARGARESLVLFDDRAYVVGVPKRTVITVMDRSEALGNVFTNIDSTYVAR